MLIKRMLARPSHGHGQRGDTPRSRQGGESADEMVQDPCCKVYVPMSRSVRVFSGGTTQYYCSEDCARRHADGKC